jgi:hypothetical protein
MQEAAAVRRAALDMVRDVEPAPLRDRIEGELGGSMAPGVLTVLTVRALADGPTAVDADETLADPLAERAAGVQLIYDGLRLTRQLAAAEPWTASETDADDGDLAVLAADVLVARGFYLLARTDAADAAVATVRAFGRDQTLSREAGDDGLDRNLEADVLELAVVAGATVHGPHPSPGLREYAAGMANGSPFPDAGALFGEAVTDTLGTIAAETGGETGVTTSVDR